MNDFERVKMETWGEKGGKRVQGNRQARGGGANAPNSETKVSIQNRKTKGGIVKKRGKGENYWSEEEK